MRKWIGSWWRGDSLVKSSRRRASCRLHLEAFEERCLLSGINEIRLVESAPLPFGITAGPDGALWFTESGSGKIGRISTTGAIAEYLFPRADSSSEGIVGGPD